MVRNTSDVHIAAGVIALKNLQRMTSVASRKISKSYFLLYFIILFLLYF